MKAVNLLLALAVGSMATGAVAAEKYIPSLYNFSVMYDFNPVKGKVKELTTHIISKDQGYDYKINVSLTPDGCIQSLTRTGKYAYGEAHLTKQGQQLTGTANNSPVAYALDEHCNLTGMSDKYGKTTYRTNKAGFIVETTLNDRRFSSHTYNDNGSLVRAEFYMYDGTVLPTEVTYKDEVMKPFDAEIKTLSPVGGSYYARNVCQYDKNQVPVKCSAFITETKDGVAKEREDISSTEVVYY